MWRAVDRANVVLLINLSQCFLHSKKEQASVAPRQGTWGFVLELHEFKVAGNQIKVGNVGLADDLCDRNGVFVTDPVVKSSPIQQVEFGLNSVQGSQRHLRVEIDREHTAISECKALSQMSRGRGLSLTALEVHHTDDLEVIARPPTGQLVARFPGGFLQ